MAFLTPHQLISHLHLKRGATVADIGAGSGAYTVGLAQAVGDEGKVYAIDVNKDLLETLKSSLDKAGYLNSDIIWADLEDGVYLDSYSLDAAVLSNVLFMLTDKEKALTEVGRLLAPGGSLLVVDWSHSHGGLGPHKDHVVSRDDAEKLLQKVGFTVHERLFAGDYHYALLATM